MGDESAAAAWKFGPRPAPVPRYGAANVCKPGNLRAVAAALTPARPKKPPAFAKALRTFAEAGAGGGRLFVQACVLAGCDYYESAEGVGVVAAFQEIARRRRETPNGRISNAAAALRGDPAAADKDAAAAEAAERAYYH